MNKNNIKDIENIVKKSVDIINSNRINKKKINKNFDSDLSEIDSLGLVMLTMNIDEKIFEKYGKDIKLNKFFSKKKISLNSIVLYIDEQIKKN